MRSSKSRLLLPLCGLALLLSSCGTADQRAARARVAPQATAPALAPTPPAPPPVAKADPVPALVALAEEQYQQGETNYNAGHLEAARQNFDAAFNLLTTGPVDAASDDRLQAEFDKIVEGTRQIELAALKQGDGFSGPPSQPAPIDEANEVTFPVDPKLKAEAEAQLQTTHSDLPLVMNDYVASYINFYTTRGRGVLERALVRAGRYRPMIQKTFKEVGVPQDLIYLAQAESGFQPLALSRAGARGMWQFIASRASGYGLERNWWVDERQDPEKSTRAAAQHLKDLYDQFGDWYLAMAAYNSGPLNVQQAVQRTGFADFWELYKRDVLPKETKNYVPIILAMTIIAKNPGQYGLTDIQPDQPLDPDTVTIDYPLDLRLAAECVDVPLETLQDLNPSLLRLTTPKDQSFALHLPQGAKDKFQEAIAAIPVDKRVWWRYHKVAEGETMASIAHQYHTTPASITEVNGLDADEITPGARLIIPVAPGRAEKERVAYAKHPTRYKVRTGDTVLSVADDFGVPPEKVRRWNRLNGNTLRRGRVLLIYRPLTGEALDHAPAVKSKRSKHLRRTVAKAAKSAQASKKAARKTSPRIASTLASTGPR